MLLVLIKFGATLNSSNLVWYIQQHMFLSFNGLPKNGFNDSNNLCYELCDMLFGILEKKSLCTWWCIEQWFNTFTYVMLTILVTYTTQHIMVHLYSICKCP
jgi:hypothetical protein